MYFYFDISPNILAEGSYPWSEYMRIKDEVSGLSNP
jgi:hypothetical protein